MANLSLNEVIRILYATILLVGYWLIYKSIALADIEKLASINTVVVLVFAVLLGAVMYHVYRVTLFPTFMWLHDLAQKNTPRNFIKERYPRLKALGSHKSTIEAIRVYRNALRGQTWDPNLVIVGSVVHLLYQSFVVGLGFSIAAVIAGELGSALILVSCAIGSFVFGYLINSHVEKDELFVLKGMENLLDDAATRLGYKENPR